MKTFSTSAGFTFVSLKEGLSHYKTLLVLVMTILGFFYPAITIMKIASSQHTYTLYYVFGISYMAVKIVASLLYSVSIKL